MATAEAIRQRTLADGVREFTHRIGLFLHMMARNKIGFIGFLGVTFFILLSLVGPYFIKLDNQAKVDLIFHPPSWRHPLGYDHQGRDVFSQIVHGGKDLLYVAFLAAVMITFVSVLFGSLSAIAGGFLDASIMWLANVILTIPRFPLLAVLAAFIKLNNLTLLAVLLAVLGWPGLTRAIRSQVLSLKQRDYVEAARALGLSTRHIIFAEIMPNMMSFIAINFTLAMTTSMYQQQGLIFLGFVPMSGNNWAVMINLAWVRGSIFYKDSMWYILGPVLCIALFQLAVVYMSRSLEEAFNPRLRTGV